MSATEERVGAAARGAARAGRGEPAGARANASEERVGAVASSPRDAAIARRAQRLLPGFLATGMSAFVAAVVTLINTGLDAGLLLRWLHAWSLALPAAIVAAYLLRPVAWRAAVGVARWGGEQG